MHVFCSTFKKDKTNSTAMSYFSFYQKFEFTIFYPHLLKNVQILNKIYSTLTKLKNKNILRANDCRVARNSLFNCCDA